MRNIIMLSFLGLTLLYGFDFSSIKEFFSEENLISLLKEYGYFILFIWSIFEGETGLVMAGILSHTGDMNLYLSILVAAMGGFIGDQIYFYLGKLNKKWILKEFKQHRSKVAKAKILLNRYGGWVIFFQRFIYGMRTIIPMTIGVSGYSPKKYAIINLISAFIWASLTIIPSYYFGEELLSALKWLKEHFYISIIFVAMIFFILFYINKKEER